MMTPKVNGTRLTIGPVRLSYVHLLEPHSFEGDQSNAKYSANLLIPKTETETIKAIRQAIDASVKLAKAERWGGRAGTPGKINPLNDGDAKDDTLYHGHFYLNAKSVRRPGVVNRRFEPLNSDDEVYSGMWAYVSVSFYGYSIGGNGIACSIDNVMKHKDDERLGGNGASPESDFDCVPSAQDDDDL